VWSGEGRRCNYQRLAEKSKTTYNLNKTTKSMILFNHTIFGEQQYLIEIVEFFKIIIMPNIFF